MCAPPGQPRIELPMNAMPQMPQLTALDVVAQLLAAVVYLAVGAAAAAHAPRDVRTRVFLALSMANAIAASVPSAAWLFEIKDPLAFERAPLGVMLAALSLAALLLFHFSQVFPRQRPWVRGSGIQLPLAYAMTPVAVFLLVRWWPANQSQMTAQFGLLFLVFGFPLMVLLGFVLPIASIVGFLRSMRESALRREGTPDARPPLAGILLSQVAGAALALLVVGPLEAVAPESFALMFATITVSLLAQLTPLSFAAAVWKYRVLEVPAEPLAEVEAD